MKMHRFPRIPVLVFAFLLTLAVSSYADFVGKVSDLDAGDGSLAVTSDADQTTTTFKVTDETVIVNADGSPSQLMNLIEGTHVNVQSKGEGQVATKITALPDPAQQNP